MAEYNKKWADLFPATIGNQNRPAAGVDNTLPYETDKFPQHIANDPVRYDKMNAVVSQAMSNDERLNEKIKRTSDDLAAHNKDPKAHATGIAGNAATATKLQTPRTLSLTGKATGSTTFDGSSNAAINVTSVNADTASKLSTARKINITGNATGSASFDGTSDININTTVDESKHAAAANALNSMGTKTAIKDGTREPLNLSLYQVYYNGYPVSFGNLLSIGGTGGGELLAEWSGVDKGIGHLYYRNRRDAGNLWSDWCTVAFTSDINSFAPTKTGGGASGTWGINISGNADTATTASNSNKLGGYSLNTTDGAKYGSIPLVKSNGVIELGQSINWHATNNSTEDFTSVWTANTNGSVTVGAINGTLNGTATNANHASNADRATNANSASLISPFEIATANAFRNVWFSDSDTSNKACYNPNIQYNPSTNVLKVGTVQGTATNADTVDGYHASDIINRISAANTGGIVAAALDTNGYVKFANGLTVQWGYLGTTHNGSMKVTFPIAFKTIFNLVCDMIGLCTGSSDNGSLNIQSYNTTGASFFNTDDHEGTGLFWRAVGIV